MSGDFLDTNVFVYHADGAYPGKSAIARSLIAAGTAQGTAVTSFQVIQETMNVVTRKLVSPLTVLEAQEFLRDVIEPLWTVMPTPRLLNNALSLFARYGFSFYDSLIVAAALDAGCDRLVSEDFQHGQQIEGMTVVNPFRDLA